MGWIALRPEGAHRIERDVAAGDSGHVLLQVCAEPVDDLLGEVEGSPSLTGDVDDNYGIVPVHNLLGVVAELSRDELRVG
jgi:hypothetical protein